MRPLGVPLLIALAGCATLKTTPAQDFARAAWDSCPKSANIALDYIEPSGLIHYRFVGAAVGTQDLEACLRGYYAMHPRPPR